LLGFDKYNFTAFSGQKLFNQNIKGQDFMRMEVWKNRDVGTVGIGLERYILAATLLNILATPDTKAKVY